MVAKNVFETWGGYTVAEDRYWGLLLKDPHGDNSLRGRAFLDWPEYGALAEYAQHKRDTVLGRWRWPEDPNYVVYPKKPSEVEPKPGVLVVNETTGRSKDMTDAVVGACDTVLSQFGRAARAYFEAHPVRKPWHDAKPGDIWVFKHRNQGEPNVFTVHRDTGNWVNPFGTELGEKYTKDRPYGYGHDETFEPRRIWPEEKE